MRGVVLALVLLERRLRERHKQVVLARERNGTHIGEQPRRKPKREKHPEKNA